MTEVKSFRPEVLKRQSLYALVSQSRWFLVQAEAGASGDNNGSRKTSESEG